MEGDAEELGGMEFSALERERERVCGGERSDGRSAILLSIVGEL